MRVVRSVPEEQHADQDEGRGNGIPDKVHPMDALTAMKPVVLVIVIKTIPALFHLTKQPRQKSSTVSCLSQPMDQWISKKSSRPYHLTVSLVRRVGRDAPAGYVRPLIEPYVQFSRIRLTVWNL